MIGLRFFPLKSAEVRGAGTRDEPLRTTAWEARKALMWVKNITDFGRLCYLNIPCLRMNITLIFISSSSEQFTH